MKNSSSRDIYADVTNAIIAELEQGPAKWVRSWTSSANLWCPLNHSTLRPYRGINVLLLARACQHGGYARNEWLTFRQAQTLGGMVRKGSKGTLVVFWRQLSAKPSADATAKTTETEDETTRGAVIARHFYVFNVSDIEGLPEGTHQAPRDDLLPSRIIRESGAVIAPGEPCFKQTQDLVLLPDAGAFASRDEYYATAFHELAHWTAPRVGREINTKRWGDDAYALEELTAELAAAMLCSICGITTLMQSASYVDHWLRVLRADKRAIFSVTSAAQKAADYLLNCAGFQFGAEHEAEADAA